MVAHVLRLRLDLLVGALRGDRARAVRMLITTALIVAATVVVCVAICSLGARSDDIAAAVTILTGSALVFGAAFGPIAGSFGDLLDPRRFTVFGIEPKTLTPALLVGAAVSIPSAALLAVSLSIAGMWAGRGVPAIVSIPMALIGWATCIVVSRLSLALAALLLSSRRTREMTVLFILAIIVIIVPVAVFFSSLEWDGVVPPALADVIAILSVTPLGAAWALPGLIAGGAGGGAITMIVLIALASLMLGVWAWYALVRALMTRTERPVNERQRTGMGWFALTPGTPSGAIAARSLVYWLRDRRYLVNVAIVPVAAIAAVLPLIVAGVPAPLAALIPVPILALFLGWLPHNDVAYDSTAIWLHIVSGVRGISDRLGRLVPIILVATPLLAIGIAISVAFYGRWAVLPAVIGVATALFLSGLGLSSISSVLSPYPVTRPGDSPFQQPQRAGSGAGSQALVLAGALALSTPTLILGWQAVTDDVSASMPALWVGIGSGLGVAIIGVLIGAWLFETRSSRIMEFAEAI